MSNDIDGPLLLLERQRWSIDAVWPREAGQEGAGRAEGELSAGAGVALGAGGDAENEGGERGRGAGAGERERGAESGGGKGEFAVDTLKWGTHTFGSDFQKYVAAEGM